MPCRGIYIIRIFTISGGRSIGINIYIINNFIKVKYSRPNRCVIFITNDNSFRIIKVRTSDGGNGNHSVSLPIILIKIKVDQMLPSSYISSLLVSIL